MPASANRSGPAGDPQAEAGLDSSSRIAGSHRVELDKCIRSAGSSSASMNASAGSRGIEPGLDGGKCILDDQQHFGAGVRV